MNHESPREPAQRTIFLPGTFEKNMFFSSGFALLSIFVPMDMNFFHPPASIHFGFKFCCQEDNKTITLIVSYAGRRLKILLGI